MRLFLNKVLTYKGLKLMVKQREDGQYYTCIVDFNNVTEYAGTRAADLHVSLYRFIRLFDQYMITPAKETPERGDIYHVESNGDVYHFLKVTETTFTIAKDCKITKLIKIQPSGVVNVITDVRPDKKSTLYTFEHSGWVFIEMFQGKVQVPGSVKEMSHTFLVFKAKAPVENAELKLVGEENAEESVREETQEKAE